MGTANRDRFQLVFAELKRCGLLLESDARLPSVCSLVAGEPLRGSWWSHPCAQTIFQINERLEDHQDVLITKLIAGKVTFVHRQIWSELVAIGKARPDWQTGGLSANARKLLEMVDVKGELRTDQLTWARSAKVKPGDAARELEKRLLIVANQIHTESGAHAKVLETWQHWAKRIGFKPARVSLKEAMKNINDQVERMNIKFGAKAKLPWTSFVQKGGSTSPR